MCKKEKRGREKGMKNIEDALGGGLTLRTEWIEWW